MRKILIIMSLATLSTVGRAAGVNESPDSIEEYAGIAEIAINNYPVTDGSDSTKPLRDILMCRLLGFDYEWVPVSFVQFPEEGQKGIEPNYTCSERERRNLWKKLLNSNTHGSLVNLIDGKAELTVTARSLSRDETVYAGNAGIELIERPIARDALAFIVNPSNPVKNLTTEQIRKIYTGVITNWKEVGGEDMKITPYIRNRNSGSQEKFETMVMAGLEIPDFPEMQIGVAMDTPYIQLEYDPSGIAFTPYYYYSVIVDNDQTRAIGVDGVEMTKENIANGTYPYNTLVYSAVRSDIDRSSMAYKVFEYLSSPEGQRLVAESRYVPMTGGHGAAVNAPSAAGEGDTRGDNKMYDLSGKPVTNPHPGHIYIRNGEKIIQD